MKISAFFKGKSGLKFWANFLLMVLVVLAVPTITLLTLDSYTHHGEKIEVPEVTGKSVHDAERMLTERDLVLVISDSLYDPKAAPGSVLAQLPKPGSEVKSGRTVYLTTNLIGPPTAVFPRLGNSLREAEGKLKMAGFKLIDYKYVEGADKDKVISIKQGNRELHGEDRVQTNKPITIYVGAGVSDSIYLNTVDTVVVSTGESHKEEKPAAPASIDFDF